MFIYKVLDQKLQKFSKCTFLQKYSASLTFTCWVRNKKKVTFFKHLKYSVNSTINDTISNVIRRLNISERKRYVHNQLITYAAHVIQLKQSKYDRVVN